MSKEKNISKKSTENNYLYIHAARETHKTDNKNGLNAENEQKKKRKKPIKSWCKFDIECENTCVPYCQSHGLFSVFHV